MSRIHYLDLADSAIEGDTLCAEVSADGELYIRIFAFDGNADWCTQSREKMLKLRDLIDKALEIC